MNRILQTASLLTLLAFLTGCSTVEPGKIYSHVSLDSYKTAYVVIGPGCDPPIGTAIEEALQKHGVQAQGGIIERKPHDVTFYVEYEDHWRWDLTMYLFSLDIRFIDSATGQIIGTGAFRQGAFHTFPDRRETAMEVVDSIYNAK